MLVENWSSQLMSSGYQRNNLFDLRKIGSKCCPYVRFEVTCKCNISAVFQKLCYYIWYWLLLLLPKKQKQVMHSWNDGLYGKKTNYCMYQQHVKQTVDQYTVLIFYVWILIENVLFFLLKVFKRLCLPVPCSTTVPILLSNKSYLHIYITYCCLIICWKVFNIHQVWLL